MFRVAKDLCGVVKDFWTRERIPLTESMTEGSVTMQTSFSQNSKVSESSERDMKKMKTCWDKTKDRMKVIYSYVRSVLGLLFLLVIYSVIGAFLFRAIEAPHEQQQKVKIRLSRQDMINLLVNFTAGANLLNESDFRSQMSTLLSDYENDIYDAYKNGVTTDSNKVKWDFLTALFFSGTVYTTVGYGHIAPSTALGRVATMIYATIGIPLALLCLADLGKQFTFGIKFCMALGTQVFQSRCCKKARAVATQSGEFDLEESKEKVPNGTEVRPGVRVYFGYEVDMEFNLNFFVALSIAVVYIFLGAGMYMLWEDWNYLESVYFVYISISTIGFGDVIPQHPNFFLLSGVYVFIGLSLISMCINVAQEYFTRQIERAKVNIEKATELAKEKASETMHDVNKSFTKAKDRVHEMSTKKKHQINSEPHLKSTTKQPHDSIKLEDIDMPNTNSENTD